jgi:hypothetical protein
MHSIFAETVEHILPGNPLDNLDGYAGLTDWALLETVERWRRATPGSTERRLATAWEQITQRRLPWRLVYETQLRTDEAIDGLRDRITSELPADARGMRFTVDVASASVAPNNPMAEDGMVAIYDPLRDQVEQSRTAELVARLPQYSQLVRVFTDDVDAAETLGAAARAALG